MESFVYRAAAGEPNRTTVSRDGSGDFRFVDFGATVHAGAGCESTSSHEVVCREASDYAPGVFVFGGDGPDQLTSTLPSLDGEPVPLPGLVMDGGGGDDLLIGSPAPDQLFGGVGADTLRGEEGNDVLFDGALIRTEGPKETRAAVRPGRDTFDGGRGNDSVSYYRRSRGVRVYLTRPGAGAGRRGEGDTVVNVESAGGGDGDDELAGDGSANELSGGPGRDVLVGRGGSDRLSDSNGSTIVRGGHGADEIDVNPSYPEPRTKQRVRCGPGEDDVSYLRNDDFVTPDCERLATSELAEFRSLLPLRRGERPTVFQGSLFCVRGAPQDCGARLELRIARAPSRRTRSLVGTLIGRRTTPTRPFFGRKSFTVSLSRRGRSLLRRHESLVVFVARRRPPFSPTGYLTRLVAPQR